MDQYQKVYKQKKLAMAECTFVQGQIVHTAPHRMIRLRLVLTRLSNDKTQRRELCMF